MTKKFSNLLILSDLDGTFFGSKTKLIPRNLEAVKRFRDMGGLFTFSTGRVYSNLFHAVPCAEDIVNAPMSLCNGACLYDAKERRALIDYLLDVELGMDAARFLRENFPDRGLRVSTTEGFLAEPDDAVAIRNLARVAPENVTIRPLEEWAEYDWYKLVMVGTDENLIPVRQACVARYGDRLGYDKSGRNLFELHRPDRTKAAMIQTYRELYESEGRRLTVCAVGDYENDRDVLRAADIAVCPANATEDIKAICDLCLCSNDRGVIGDLVEYLEKNYDHRWGE